MILAAIFEVKAEVLTDVVVGVRIISSRSGTGRRLATCVVTDVGADVHTDSDTDPDEPRNIEPFSAFDWTQEAPHSVCSNDPAFKNMPSISVTRDTSHVERSLLNFLALKNIEDMSFTLDTSHFERSPLND